MCHLFWLRPKLIAGRSGPNRYPWIAADLAATSIGAVLSATGYEAFAVELLNALNRN